MSKTGNFAPNQYVRSFGSTEKENSVSLSAWYRSTVLT